LEAAADLTKLDDPAAFRAGQQGLVIQDEVHRAPGLFSELRGLIDQAQRAATGGTRFKAWKAGPIWPASNYQPLNQQPPAAVLARVQSMKTRQCGQPHVGILRCVSLPWFISLMAINPFRDAEQSRGKNTNFRELSASITRMTKLAIKGRIDDATVLQEVERLQHAWQTNGQKP
jgi:hypothetical protein